MSADLAQWLEQQNELTAANRQRAERLSHSSGEALFDVILRLGLSSELALAQAMAELHHCQLLTSSDYPTLLPLAADDSLPMAFFRENRLIPLHQDEQGMQVAMANPADDFAIQALQMALHTPIQVQVGLVSDIDQAWQRLFGSGQSAMDELTHGLDDSTERDEADVEQLRGMASEAPVIRLVNLMIARAIERRASDIHIEPFEQRLKIRYRIDGLLQDSEEPPANLSAAIISRVKLMSRLNIAERRLPQDGRIQLLVQGKAVDFRVSTVPTLYGESVVMRVLDKSGMVRNLDDLQLSTGNRRHFEHLLANPNGILLVTGPTGSGKTTTLYAALQQLNTSQRKILTAEDPIEYQLDGINQIQIKSQIDLSFAKALRAMVRQDPDIIMIGEMRDLETAEIAVQSALTGHMVLSTLHTNDAVNSITRLLDMGVADYLITATVNGVLAQRLVRRLCTHCRYPTPIEPRLQALLEAALDLLPQQLYQANGCDFCDQSGYHGRLAIHELLPLSEAFRQLVLQRASSTELTQQALKDGMVPLYQDGLLKAAQGLTSVAEVTRVTQNPHD